MKSVKNDISEELGVAQYLNQVIGFVCFNIDCSGHASVFVAVSCKPNTKHSMLDTIKV